MSTEKSIENFTLNTYPANQWVELARAESTIKGITIANKATGPVNAELRLVDGGGNERAIMLPPLSITAGTTECLAITDMGLGRSDILQFRASAVGLSVICSCIVKR
jgi:hypothetical protein